jgi:hypothetical protein
MKTLPERLDQLRKCFRKADYKPYSKAPNYNEGFAFMTNGYYITYFQHVDFSNREGLDIDGNYIPQKTVMVRGVIDHCLKEKSETLDKAKMRNLIDLAHAVKANKKLLVGLSKDGHVIAIHDEDRETYGGLPFFNPDLITQALCFKPEEAFLSQGQIRFTDHCFTAIVLGVK